MIRAWRILLLAILAGSLAFRIDPVRGFARAADHGTPVEASLVFSYYPALGEQTVLTATILSRVNAAVSNLSIELPASATLVSGSRTWTGAIQANQPISMIARIVFNTSGSWEVKAIAQVQENDGTVFSDATYTYLTVRSDGGSGGLPYLDNNPAKLSTSNGSFSGDRWLFLPVAFKPGIAVALPATSTSVWTDVDPPLLDPTIVFSRAQPESIAQGLLTVSGAWLHTDRSGAKVPFSYALVQLLRGNNQAHLAFAYTDSSGNFTFPAVDNPGDGGVIVRAYAFVDWGPNGYQLMVIPPGRTANWYNAYYGATSRYIFLDGAHTVGEWWFDPPSTFPANKAVWAHIDLRKAFFYPPDQAGPVTIEWSPFNIDGAHYTPGGVIHLEAASLDLPHPLLHAYAHNIMYNMYHALPTDDCINPGIINRAGGVSCGWTEGWAYFFALSVLQDTSYRWPGGGSMDLEAPTWWAPNWDSGPGVAGRVAATLLDLEDAFNDGYDQYVTGFIPIWETFYLRPVDTLAELFDSWQRQGKAARPFQAAAYQNTIDFDYKPRFQLTWNPTPANMDIHIWQTSSNFHIYPGDMGSSTTYPWTALDRDDQDGPGPETITIYQPYPGAYKIAGFCQAGCAGSGAEISYYLGPYLVTSWTVPSFGWGSWWLASTFDALAGSYQTVNLIQLPPPGEMTLPNGYDSRVRLP